MVDILDPNAPAVGVILRNADGTTYSATGVGSFDGAVTVADGADATQGAKADAAANADTGTFSVVAILKRIVAKLTGIATNTTGLAQESGGNLDAIATAEGTTADAPVTDPAAPATVLARLAGLEALLQPVSVSGTLSLVGDVVTLDLGGRPGAALEFTRNIDVTFDGNITIQVSSDGGISWTGNAAIWDTWHTFQWLEHFGPNGAEPTGNVGYGILVTPGATHIRVALNALGASPASPADIGVLLWGTATSRLPGMSEGFPGIISPNGLLTIGATDAAGNLQAVVFGPAQGLVTEPAFVQSTPLALEAASKATRVSPDIIVTGSGVSLVLQLANKANTPTITAKVEGKTLSGTYYTLWTAAAAAAANGTFVYQIGPGAVPAAGGITEGKVALIPGVIRITLTYAGNGTTDVFDTTLDLDITP